MTNTADRQHRSILQRIARRVMMERRLLPDFSVQAIAELNGIQGAAVRVEESTQTLVHSNQTERRIHGHDSSTDVESVVGQHSYLKTYS
jgi:hypothetical protein